ncbi:hypothetical protein D6853_15085 [Butyrivibrio sp. X503]|uniref:hypothetical protein n=1 Tax=Butyrivibrio sp. X503 TaxID=2364878 RepID=UPI000EA8AFA8|nr:hypothetical protein [Butyrivibrio sp. X503]RKM53786.1 hypothetical protein D6853_15085 [Butyrivibrio sp. X503]
MKRIIAPLLVFLLSFTLIACGNNQKKDVKNALVENGLSSEEADEFVNEFSEEDLEYLTENYEGEQDESEASEDEDIKSTYNEKQFEPCEEIINASLKDAYVQIDDVLLKMDGSMTIGEVVDLLKQGVDGEYYSFSAERSDEEFQFDTALIAKNEDMYIVVYKNGKEYAELMAFFDEGQSEESAILVKNALFVDLRPFAVYDPKCLDNIFIFKGMPFNGTGYDYTSIENLIPPELAPPEKLLDSIYFDDDCFQVVAWDNNPLPSGRRCKRLYDFQIDMSTQQLVRVYMRCDKIMTPLSTP